MCRWLAYTGFPLSLEHALHVPADSRIDQSSAVSPQAETTNRDGFWRRMRPTEAADHDGPRGAIVGLGPGAYSCASGSR